jgi:hypothetical protein
MSRACATLGASVVALHKLIAELEAGDDAE